MKQYRLTVRVMVSLIFVVAGLFCASVFAYRPLVHRGIIAASGGDQKIVSPPWARVVFALAARIVRHHDLSRFRDHYLGTWTSTDPSFPYQIELKSIAFDTGSGQQFIAGKISNISLRNMVHHLHREPFGDTAMIVEGADEWCLFFKKNGQLVLSVPSGEQQDRFRPTRRIELHKLASE